MLHSQSPKEEGARPKVIRWQEGAGVPDALVDLREIGPQDLQCGYCPAFIKLSDAGSFLRALEKNLRPKIAVPDAWLGTHAEKVLVRERPVYCPMVRFERSPVFDLVTSLFPEVARSCSGMEHPQGRVLINCNGDFQGIICVGANALLPRAHPETPWMIRPDGSIKTLKV